MSHQPQKRLIEISLPLAKISEQSAREKSIRHGHISTPHIWWARRPLAAIFASLIPAPENDEERVKLERLIEIIVDWNQVKKGNSEAIEEAKRLIRAAFPDGPLCPGNRGIGTAWPASWPGPPRAGRSNFA